MAKRDPLTYPRLMKRLPTLFRTLKQKAPRIGVTQGGSSREDSGARPAATDGLFRPRNQYLGD
jgi:hypothetical protein